MLRRNGPGLDPPLSNCKRNESERALAHDCTETSTAAGRVVWPVWHIDESKTRLYGLSSNGVMRLENEHLAVNSMYAVEEL